ncbi:MAG TPA: hypothetical protein DEG42_07555 [Acholeplasmataceae bacterium]|nr:hypothetical protein [Acholeplasmataceae bacterium]
MLHLTKKQIILALLVINLLFTSGMTFAFWASSISGNSGNNDGLINIGDWGTPIFTPSEFYTFATKTNSLATDNYYIANDIDFTGFTWTYNATNNAVTFRGTLNGNGKTLSNLTITNTSTSYLYNGIFPRLNGATIHDLTLENINTITTLTGTSQRSGLIAGNAWGGTNTLTNITIIDSGSQGNSTNGVGGLIGNVQNSTTILNLNNIKATNLRVFNRSAYVGGLVGRISTSGARVTMNDVDFQGQVYAYTSSGYSGGLIGYTPSGSYFTLNRAIVEATFQNTLVTNATYYLRYSDRYLGGIIGYNAAVAANINITDAFFTGSLFNQTNTYRAAVGTVSGRDATQATLLRTYHSYVAYRTATGTVSYTQTGQTGQMATVVSATAMPTSVWWDGFYVNLVAGNTDWMQTPVTGRPYLNRA